jgi:hypothetical protein
MKRVLSSILLGTTFFTLACGEGNKPATGKDNAAAKTGTTTAKNFNTVAEAAPGTIISELSYVEKVNGKELSGKYITKYFDDVTKTVVTIYRKANNEVYEAGVYTINKADLKGLKSDISPLNDGSDNYRTYSPKDFGAVSVVFNGASSEANAKPITVKSYSVFMGETKEEETKENSFRIPMADYKTADEWAKKLQASLKAK